MRTGEKVLPLAKRFTPLYPLSDRMGVQKTSGKAPESGPIHPGDRAVGRTMWGSLTDLQHTPCKVYRPITER